MPIRSKYLYNGRESSHYTGILTTIDLLQDLLWGSANTAYPETAISGSIGMSWMRVGLFGMHAVDPRLTHKYMGKKREYCVQIIDNQCIGPVSQIKVHTYFGGTRPGDNSLLQSSTMQVKIATIGGETSWLTEIEQSWVDDLTLHYRTQWAELYDVLHGPESSAVDGTLSPYPLVRQLSHDRLAGHIQALPRKKFRNPSRIIV